MRQEKERFLDGLVGPKRYALDLLAVIVLSIVAALSAFLLPEGNLIRIILGTIFLLFCIGYGLVSILWPGKDDLSDLERLALSFGLSMAMIIIVGLGLNYTPWGIAQGPVTISLLLFVIATSLVAWFRRMRTPANERFYPSLEPYLPKGELSKSDRLLAVLIVASLVAAGVILGYVVVTLKPGEKYTEFYVLDGNGGTTAYPKNLTVGETATLRIGAVNHEGERTEYSVRVDLLNETAQRDNIGNLSFSLNDGETFEGDFDFNISLNGTYRLELLLFKGSSTTPYLELHLNGIIARD